jgi:hypothetical protein
MEVTLDREVATPAANRAGISFGTPAKPLNPHETSILAGERGGTEAKDGVVG